MLSSVFWERKEGEGWARMVAGLDQAGQTAAAEDGGSNVRLADRLFTTTIFSFLISSRGKRGGDGGIVEKWGKYGLYGVGCLTGSKFSCLSLGIVCTTGIAMRAAVALAFCCRGLFSVQEREREGRVTKLCMAFFAARYFMRRRR